MALTNRAAIKSDVTTNIPDNNANEVSAADVRGPLIDLADSAIFKEDDRALLGFTKFDSTQTYPADSAVRYDGKLWVLKDSAAPLSPGPFDATKWTQVQLMDGVDQAAAWAAGTTYALDDVVSFDNRIWQSLQNSNTGNIPSTSPGTWQEISPADTAKLVTLNAETGTALLTDQLADYAGSLVVATSAQSARSTAMETAMDKGLVREVSPGLGTRIKIYAHEDFTLAKHAAMRTHELRLDGALGLSGLLSFTPHPLS